MAKRYDGALIPHRVIMMMHPEDVANCYDLRLCAADIPVAAPGEPAAPNGLYLRQPDRTRKHAIWYFNEVIGETRKQISTRCHADNLDGAIAWVLTRLARRADTARSRLAPESLSACAIFVDYAKMVKEQVRRGEILEVTAINYFNALRLLGQCHKNASVATIMTGGARAMFKWCERNGYSHNTAVHANNLCKRAINAVMAARNSAYRIDFVVGHCTPRVKRPYTPDEIVRIKDRIWNGTVYGPDLKPAIERDAATGLLVPKRCSERAFLMSYPFRVAVPFMLDSGSRKDVACQTTVTDPSGAFLDLDSGILHRRGLMTEDVANKRRGSCVMSSAFMDFIRPIAEAGLARGATHLVTYADGSPVPRLSLAMWYNIQRDAQVPLRVIHCLKDTAIQIARIEGVPLYSAAERFATTPMTLVAHYGADWDVGVQIDPAEAQGTRSKWLRMHEAVKARAAAAEAGRIARAERAKLGKGNAKTRALPTAKPPMLLLPPPAKGVGAEAPAEQPARSAEGQPQEGRVALPGDAHDAARLKDRKPTGPRR
ncbi:MAG: hypothetical protein ABSF67_00815 [Roseiarcus sp.]|jgi:hypothetical protein